MYLSCEIRIWYCIHVCSLDSALAGKHFSLVSWHALKYCFLCHTLIYLVLPNKCTGSHACYNAII